VLPKTLTGKQVRDIMEQWQGQLGVHCNACHTADPKNVGPNGRPRLNFADDSKPEKNAARLMYTMTNKINDDTISMVDMNMDQAEGSHEDHSEHKVTCGTCHRGHLKPEAFIPPPEHEGPPPVPAGTPRVPR
jgi:mono/diheme cytochrome c family protein